MKLSELHSITEKYIEDGHGEESVVITLKQPSVGPRAFVNVTHAFVGFDWEHGQFRIDPEKPLTSYDKDRDTAICPKTRMSLVGTGSRTLRPCPKCGNNLTKKFRYCPYCGQRVLSASEELAEKKAGNNHG